MTARKTKPRAFDVVLVLSGGNAPGAFRAGVYQALHDNGLAPDWIVGASIGAVSRANRRVGAGPADRHFACLLTACDFGLGQAGLPSVIKNCASHARGQLDAGGGAAGVLRPAAVDADAVDRRPAVAVRNQPARSDAQRTGRFRCAERRTVPLHRERGRPAAARGNIADDDRRERRTDAGPDLCRAVAPQHRAVAGGLCEPGRRRRRAVADGHAAQDHEVAGKALDFSRPNDRAALRVGEIRRAAGGCAGAERSLPIGKRGLHRTDLNDDGDLAGTPTPRISRGRPPTTRRR